MAGWTSTALALVGRVGAKLERGKATRTGGLTLTFWSRREGLASM